MRRAAARHKRHQAARRRRLKLCSEPRQSFVQQLLDGTSSLPRECFKVYRCTFESMVAFILDMRSRSAVVGAMGQAKGRLWTSQQHLTTAPVRSDTESVSKKLWFEHH